MERIPDVTGGLPYFTNNYTYNLLNMLVFKYLLNFRKLKLYIYLNNLGAQAFRENGLISISFSRFCQNVRSTFSNDYDII